MKKIFMSILMGIFLSSFYLSVQAGNPKLSMEPLVGEQRETAFQNISISLWEELPDELRIDCFAVNENGLIAIGFGGASAPKYVGIYDRNGNFKYAYCIVSAGTYKLDWQGENLAIYFSKSDYYIVVNQNAEIMEIYEVPLTNENMSYVQDILGASKKKCGEVVYQLRNRGVYFWKNSSPFSQLTAVNADGEKIIIYDSSFNPIPYVIFGVCFALFMFLCLVLNLKVRKVEESEELL